MDRGVYFNQGIYFKTSWVLFRKLSLLILFLVAHISAQRVISLSRGYTEVFQQVYPIIHPSDVLLEPLISNAWSGSSSGTYAGRRIGFHYMPGMRGINQPVKLTELEYHCMAFAPSFEATSCGDRRNVWFPVCHDDNVDNTLYPYNLLGPDGFKPVLLIYEFGLNFADAKAANIRFYNWNQALVPTNAEVNTITTDGSQGRHAVWMYHYFGRETDCVSPMPVRKHNFVLPERFQIQLNPDRNYLIGFVLIPKRSGYFWNANAGNEPWATVVMLPMEPMNCQNPFQGEPIMSYLTMNIGQFTCSASVGYFMPPWEVWAPFGTARCTCANCNCVWRDMKANRFHGVDVKAQLVGATCGADINCSGCVDESDLVSVLFAFGGNSSEADVNNDGVVDDSDLLSVLFSFGQGC